MLKGLCLSALLVVPSLALAQKQVHEPPRTRYAPAAQHIDIGEGDEVIGEFTRPEGPIVGSANHGPKTSLIKIRWSFVPELMKSASDH